MLHCFTHVRPWRSSMIVPIALAMLGGCASYRPHPLTGRASLAKSVSELQTDVDARQQARLGAHTVNPADGLDLTEIAILAVLNNPDLKAGRARLNVAGAQLFAAGLLPDPQISAGLDHPTGNTAGLVTAWAFGLNYELLPLITRQARIDAERQGVVQVNLALLWQEWQVMQQARTLAVRYQLEEERLALLRSMLSLYQSRYRRSAQGLAEGNVTLDVNGTDLTALVDTYSQINQLEQSHNETRHSLNLLLGLDGAAAVPLSPLSDAAPLPDALIRRQLPSLSLRRPDLLALKAGYRSQEAKVRAAILAQFPSLSVGFARGRDTSNIHTSGLSVSLNLPIFSGNRGPVAMERATREQLFEEYQARLAQTDSDVSTLGGLQGILVRQVHVLDDYLPRLKGLVEGARRAYGHGDIDALTFLNMESTWVNKELERIRLKQGLWENRIALETLLALPGSVPAEMLPVSNGPDAAQRQ